MAYRTSKAMATGLGAAGSGVHHWWSSRVSSVALVPLGGALVVHAFREAAAGGEPGLRAVLGRHRVVAVLIFVAAVTIFVALRTASSPPAAPFAGKTSRWPKRRR